MKTKLLTLFSLLALLLVSTSILANGRPTGVRISRLVSGGGLNVEMDVTITGTNRFYPNADTGWTQTTTAWLGNTLYTAFSLDFVGQTDGNGNNLPPAIDWGDGITVGDAQLFGPAGGPFTGTFTHTYALSGTYAVTVGDAYGPDFRILGKGAVPFTGNAISDSVRYVQNVDDTITYGTFSYATPILLAITANATVTTGTGIPALNIYGLLAMAFVLVGTGVLLIRKPTVA